MKKEGLAISEIILILFAAVLIFLSIILPNSSWGQNFVMNLSTEILGALLIFFLIDSIIERNENREKIKYEQIALSQLKFPIRHHIDFLFNLHKASILERPEKRKSKFKDFFTEDFIEPINYLDFSKDAPQRPKVNYYIYFYNECKHFKDDLNITLGNYSIYLSPDTLELITAIINSNFMFFVSTIRYRQEFIEKNNIIDGDACLQGIAQHIFSDYLGFITRLIDKYNTNSSDTNKISMDIFDWSNDIEPKIGSARIKV